MSLYDPGEHPTEFPAEVVSDFTVAAFLEWARAKPAREPYDYWSVCNCAVEQFVRERALGGEHWGRLHTGAAGQAVCTSPWTFGALADRLAKLSA